MKRGEIKRDGESTEIGSNSIHVSIVSFPKQRIPRAVAVSKESGSVVNDEGEQEHHCGSRNPSQLSYGPC